jgi:LuxR family transcriptional regulator, maltose regulon positive regulatory protein
VVRRVFRDAVGVTPHSQGAEISAALVPLVETKFTPPRLRQSVISRPRLQKALDTLVSSELTLISAPAGGGKTVLLGSWCTSRPDAAIAWVSLEPADDDAVRLWTYVATAVDRIRPGLGRLALLRLRTPGVALQTSVDELLNGISAYGEPITVALDDIHVLQSAPCLESLEYAVEHLPSNARVIATTRADPPIALARLRGHGQLSELRTRDLAFSVDEARALLVDGEGLGLDDDDLEQLVDRSEGWPAGLYMAALWLRSTPDPKAGVQDFSGDHRHVADFLTNEVLASLDHETRDFLLKTSVLGRFNASLCDAVLDGDGAAAKLEELANSNLFLISLDPRGDWYRYHHLFSDLLQMELRQSDPEAELTLRAKASAWCRSHGLVEEAIEHSAAAGNHVLVAEMLLDQHRILLRNGHFTTLLRRVGNLPEAILLEHPELAAAAALASGLRSGPASERRWLLAIAERSRVERPAAWTSYAEAGVSLARATWIDGDVGASVEHGRRAVELEEREGSEVAVAALAALAYALLLAGDHDGAGAAARKAVDRTEAHKRPHGLLYALATLSLLDTEKGRARAGETTARRALAIARETGLARASTTGHAYVALAAALAAQGDLRQAEHEAERAEALRRGPEPSLWHVHVLLVLAGIRAARGELSVATEELARAREAIASFTDPGRLPELAADVEHSLKQARIGAAVAVEEPTAAEFAVLRLLATDLTQREIGRALYLSLNTVKTHTRGIYRKLGARSRDEAITRASALGLIDSDQSPG